MIKLVRPCHLFIEVPVPHQKSVPSCIYVLRVSNSPKLNNTNPTEKGDELGCSGRLSISCFTNGVRCIIIPNMPVINLQK
jgi:hypothetical protein